jgi:hypothetical protein
METERMLPLDLDVNTMIDATRNKVESLCEQVYSKPLKQCSREEVMIIIEMDVRIGIKDLRVSVSNTRQIIAYTPNSYGADLTIDFSAVQRYMVEQVSLEATPIKILEKYLKLRSVFIGLLSMKFRNSEELLRNLCREAEVKDGVEPLGRFKQ